MEQRYEHVLCNTKLRWGRRVAGNPKEQEQEAWERQGEQLPEKEALMEKEIVSNMSREVYDPGTKVADFRKMRVTDLKDNPHVHLPRPRPPEEERLLEAKGVIRENILQPVQGPELH